MNRYWIVGRCFFDEIQDHTEKWHDTNPHIEIIGVASDETKAVEFCLDKSYWIVGPLELDIMLPPDVMPDNIKGYYPKGD
ncbi:MAG TPA: hypothetical protein VJ201_03445 [Candidatus Babeliales bacterium]|nr:hypothetical protein [Candidatus Babeliales bacterium]